MPERIASTVTPPLLLNLQAGSDRRGLPPRRYAAGRYPHLIALRALHRRPARLTPMPDEEQVEPTDDHADEATPEESVGRVFSPYGVASAVLGALCVAAVALGVVIWSSHRSDVQERSYQSRAMQAAADWTGVLINMTTDNIKESLQRLHDGTVGQLNADF